MRARAHTAGPGAEREPPTSLRPLYDARRMRSIAAVRAAIAALGCQGRRVTLAAIEQTSRDLPEGAVSAKTVLRNPECRALYAAAAGRSGSVRSIRSGLRALGAELAAAASAEANMAPAAPSTAEVRRVRRLERHSKRELAAMVIRLEREVEALHRHNANLRECLLQNGLKRSVWIETKPSRPRSRDRDRLGCAGCVRAMDARIRPRSA